MLRHGHGELLKAVQSANLVEVNRLIGNGADVHEEDEDGDTPLHFAAGNGLSEVVHLLLEMRADITARNKNNNGMTPLHLAAEYDHLEVARALLDARADITAKNNDGETPLDMATEKCHGAVVALLEEAPALYDAQAAAEEGLRLAIAEQAVWTAERENRY
mmetsp:Transcript_35081/g.79858  ORF Transcript_35081/g.79858 Transcript_35081/m.79858 type:complete len:161 (+) Transcript_35081:70-552(+)